MLSSDLVEVAADVSSEVCARSMAAPHHLQAASALSPSPPKGGVTSIKKVKRKTCGLHRTLSG